MNKNKNDIDEILYDINSVSSMQDCTGLIARGPVDDAEYENYMNLLKFSPKNIETKNNKTY